MPAGILKDMLSSCPNEGALMALDLGSKTIGVAVSDSARKIAIPVTTVKRTKFTKDILVLAEMIRDYDVRGYVLGFPLNMDGSEGPRCQSVRHFAENMHHHPDIFGPAPWIAFQDERLSTDTVHNFLIESVDMSRTKRKQVVDKLAAQIILDSALSFIHRSCG